jgi:hypothetical protein
VKGPAKGYHAALQFIINLAHLPTPFELVGGEAKAREHDHQDEAVPDLQTPADGFEDHLSGNIQHPTSNIERPMNPASGHSMLGVECWMLDVFIRYSMQ